MTSPVAQHPARPIARHLVGVGTGETQVGADRVIEQVVACGSQPMQAYPFGPVSSAIFQGAPLRDAAWSGQRPLHGPLGDRGFAGRMGLAGPPGAFW